VGRRTQFSAQIRQETAIATRSCWYCGIDHSIQGAFDVCRYIEPCPGKPVLIQRRPIIIFIITMCYTYVSGGFQCLLATVRALSLLIPIACIPPEQVHYAIDF
jgi:hypothetical protein